jgi:hypothetical protein
MKKRSVIITASIVIAGAIWIGTVGAAVRAAAVAPKSWPSDSNLVLNHEAPTLVMLVHPQCSCTRASLAELQAVIEKSPRTLRTYVVVYRPHQAKAGWEKTAVYEAATRLRGTHVIVDEDGREAKRFGTFTSGQTFLYDATGTLRFEGGITMLRGHAGLNSGRAGVIHIANGEAGKGTHPVFGCSIVSRGEKR